MASPTRGLIKIAVGAGALYFLGFRNLDIAMNWYNNRWVLLVSWSHGLARRRAAAREWEGGAPHKARRLCVAHLRVALPPPVNQHYAVIMSANSSGSCCSRLNRWVPLCCRPRRTSTAALRLCLLSKPPALFVVLPLMCAGEASHPCREAGQQLKHGGSGGAAAAAAERRAVPGHPEAGQWGVPAVRMHIASGQASALHRAPS